MKHALIIGLLFVVTASSAQFHPAPIIKRYRTEINTHNGKVSGILEQNNDNYVIISNSSGIRSIPVTSIKSIKIREPRKTKIVEISPMPEPTMFDYDENGQLRTDYVPPTVGERAATGIASSVLSFFYRVFKGEYSSLDKFTINYNEDEYQTHRQALSNYSVYYQTNPPLGIDFFRLLPSKTSP